MRFTGQPEWQSKLIAALANSLGLILIIVIQYVVFFETGTVFLNRADYLDPALCWTGCKNTGRGGGLSIIGYHNLTRPKSYHLKKVTK